MKKKLSVVLAACLTAVTAVSVAGCGDSKTQAGNKPVGDRTQISFLCGNNSKSESAWLELIGAYNDGAGYETDNTYVNVELGTNTSPNTFTKSKDEAYNVVMVTDSISNTFVNFAYKADGRKCPDGYMLSLEKYAQNDDDFKNNTISDSVMDWWRMTRNPDAKKGAGQPKHVIGAGQNLLAVPVSSNAHFNWYNEKIFKSQGINIISVPEEELDKYNADNGANLKPHGYAEYKEAPVAGMEKSKNLLGNDVYKVFNNCIGMNWEEQRNILKYFSPEHNDGSATGTKSPTKYGFVSEYWFNYGWSVGGDVMGYNGREYDFTLFDTSANYIVTKNDTVINGATYAAGEIVRYEDKVNQTDIATMDGVYAIESQYNAIKEYVSLQVATDTVVDERGGKTYKGYGVADPDTGKAKIWFNNGELAMTRGSEFEENRMSNPDFNICLPETYREYEGGSVYYSGNDANDFKNEHLKVIGETYDGEVYTGDIKKVDGTPIIGSSTSASICQALAIPACSDPEKYQSAWNFISWVATEGQKYIAKTTTFPVAVETAFGADFAKNDEISQGKNLYAVAKVSVNAGRGDWGYFENGSWVTNWSNPFNEEVRRGKKKLSAFEQERAAAAKTALNDMFCVIKGIR